MPAASHGPRPHQAAPGDSWDCIVVGAGAAGLSAALTLGRALRATLVIDAGRQSNLAATGIGGLLGHDGRPPAELYAAGRSELAAYRTVEVRDDEVTAITAAADGHFVVSCAGGGDETAARIVLALGVNYDHPVVPGLEERWGRSVYHCPFCHGYEHRGQTLGVLANGPMAAMGAITSLAYTDDITLLTHGDHTLTDEQRAQLAAKGVAVDERPIAALHGPPDGLDTVEFADGDRVALQALLVKTTLRQRSTLTRDLGATVSTATAAMAVEAVDIDARYQTSVPGVFAAGDMATLAPPSIQSAMAAGFMAGASAVMSLLLTP